MQTSIKVVKVVSVLPPYIDKLRPPHGVRLGVLQLAVRVPDDYSGLEPALRAKLGHYVNLMVQGVVEGGTIVPPPPTVPWIYRAF